MLPFSIAAVGSGEPLIYSEGNPENVDTPVCFSLCNGIDRRVWIAAIRPDTRRRRPSNIRELCLPSSMITRGSFAQARIYTAAQAPDCKSLTHSRQPFRYWKVGAAHSTIE